jgi:4,5-dihydroxyphthalate decarboxylase
MTHKLKTVFRLLGHTEALLDGRVQPDGFAIDYVERPMLIKGFREMVREQSHDICELAMTTYMCARAYGKPITAIPVFPARGLHHGAIFVHRDSGITDPKQLEGRKVGVNRGYTVTTGVWARGILATEYGVDLKKVTWILSGDEHVAEYQAPANVIAMPEGDDLSDMLRRGELAAAIGIAAEDSDFVPLINHPEQTAMDWARRTGIYPINHTVVIRDELLADNPALATTVFRAFSEARSLYIDELNKISENALTGADQQNKVIGEILGEPLPYGFEANRKPLEVLAGHAEAQGILPAGTRLESLFATNTLDLKA